jgi:hypothetical protein
MVVSWAIDSLSHNITMFTQLKSKVDPGDHFEVKVWVPPVTISKPTFLRRFINVFFFLRYNWVMVRF